MLGEDGKLKGCGEWRRCKRRCQEGVPLPPHAVLHSQIPGLEMCRGHLGPSLLAPVSPAVCLQRGARGRETSCWCAASAPMPTTPRAAATVRLLRLGAGYVGSREGF